MTPKRIAALAGVLALLLAAAGLQVWRSGRLARLEPLKGLKETEVYRVEISRAGEAIVLERRAGSWRIAAPIPDSADQDACAGLVEALANLTLGTEVSRKPESYPDYELAESSATRIRLFTAGRAAPAFDGFFGKTAMGYDTLYFRSHAEKPVYLASGMARYYLEREAGDYRERALVKWDRGALTGLLLSSGDSTIELKKSSAGWAASGASLSPERIEAAVAAVSNLRLVDFSSATAREAGLEKPSLAVLASKGEESLRVLLGKPRPEPKGQKPLTRYARLAGREAVGLVSVYDADSLLELFGKKGTRVSRTP